MYKYVVACGVTCLATVIVTWAAEPYTGFLSSGPTNSLPSSSTTSALPKKSGPIPPEQFKQQVQAAGDANRQRMADQLQQYTSQATPPSYQAPTPTSATPSVGTAPAPTAATPPIAAAPAGTPTAGTATPNSANRAAPTTTPSTTQPASNSTQVYTGFGSGNNAPAGGGNNNAGGGWNIRY